MSISLTFHLILKHLLHLFQASIKNLQSDVCSWDLSLVQSSASVKWKLRWTHIFKVIHKCLPYIHQKKKKKKVWDSENLNLHKTKLSKIYHLTANVIMESQSCENFGNRNVLCYEYQIASRIVTIWLTKFSVYLKI